MIDILLVTLSIIFVYVGLMAILGSIYLYDWSEAKERKPTNNEKIGILLWPISAPVIIGLICLASVLFPFFWIYEKYGSSDEQA